MRLALIILGIFFLSLTVRSANGREPNYQEKVIIGTYKRTHKVKSYMQDNINPDLLSFSEYLSFQLMKKACAPMDYALKQLEKRDQEYPDQTHNLVKAYGVCSEATHGLSSLYIQQH